MGLDALLPRLLVVLLAVCHGSCLSCRTNSTSFCSVPVVRVEQGALKGHYLTSRKGRSIVSFHGIPYARPPLGDLRFRSPQPPEPWTGVRDATKDSSICTQRSIFARQKNVAGVEDCLYLNVYSPQIPSNSTGGDHPVMVWFHGGGWVSGAGTSGFYGPTVLLDKDIVLVTLNYRLGPIGFLSTGDEAAPGNFGMKDQVAALRWVRDNIAAFGGNPDSVTIFGESAGGASVHYHMMSPMSKGLFHRGISQSGTALCSWVLAPNGSSKHQAEKLGRFLHCPTNSSAELVACLRGKDVRDIIETDKMFMEWDVDPLIPFKPVIETSVLDGEERFISVDPLHMLQDTRRTSNIPWMTGLNSGDGALKAAPIYGEKHLVEELDQEFSRIAPISMFYGETSTQTDEVSQRIREFYFGKQAISNETIYEVVDMFTDNWFLHGEDVAVKLQASISQAPIYYYYFAYRGTKSFSELFGNTTRDFGVCHADELQYLFPQSRVFPDLIPSEDDERMADILTTLWANFAHTGNPTSKKNDVVHLDWTPFSAADLEYLHIGDDLHMDSGLLQERAQFWQSLPLKSGLLSPISIKDEL